MKSNLFLFLCFFLFSVSMAGQREYLPATIETTTGQQLVGLVELKSDLELSQDIKFKATEDSSIQRFKPQDLRKLSFTASDNVYESIRINSALDSTYKKRLARKLMAGDIELYQLELPQAEKQLFKTTNNTFVFYMRLNGEIYRLELVEKQIQAYNQTGRQQLTNIVVEEYKGMLKYTLADCPKVASKVDRLKFKQDKIINLLKEYAECSGMVTNNIQSKAPAKKQVSQMISGAFIEPYGENFYEDFGFSFGYNREVLSLNRTSSISFFYGVNYTYIDRIYYFPAYPRDILEEDQLHILTIPVQINYLIRNKSDFTPFITLGTSANFFNLETPQFVPTLEYGAGLRYKDFRFSLMNKLNLPGDRASLGMYLIELSYIFSEKKK